MRARKMPVAILAVATLAGLVPVLRAADAAAPAVWLEPTAVLAAPTDAPYGLGYTSTTPAGGDSDVFTADRTGAARRNLTDRADLDEDGPAWTADGSRLAYAEHQAGGGARIVVADAQGRGRRVVAPAGTRDSDVDRDPAWAPDGLRLAFTRIRDGQASIVLVRVADAALLGVVPARSGWSPRTPSPPGRRTVPGWRSPATRAGPRRRSWCRRAWTGRPTPAASSPWTWRSPYPPCRPGRTSCSWSTRPAAWRPRSASCATSCPG